MNFVMMEEQANKDIKKLSETKAFVHSQRLELNSKLVSENKHLLLRSEANGARKRQQSMADLSPTSPDMVENLPKTVQPVKKAPVMTKSKSEINFEPKSGFINVNKVKAFAPRMLFNSTFSAISAAHSLSRSPRKTAVDFYTSFSSSKLEKSRSSVAKLTVVRDISTANRSQQGSMLPDLLAKMSASKSKQNTESTNNSVYKHNRTSSLFIPTKESSPLLAPQSIIKLSSNFLTHSPKQSLSLQPRSFYNHLYQYININKMISIVQLANKCLVNSH